MCCVVFGNLSDFLPNNLMRKNDDNLTKSLYILELNHIYLKGYSNVTSLWFGDSVFIKMIISIFKKLHQINCFNNTPEAPYKQ